MSVNFTTFYTSLSPDPAHRGKQFEHFVKWFLKADPEWATQVEQVWLWNEPDAGYSLCGFTQTRFGWCASVRSKK